MELGSSKVLLGVQPKIGLRKVYHNCSEALLFSGPRAYERPMTRRNWVPYNALGAPHGLVFQAHCMAAGSPDLCGKIPQRIISPVQSMYKHRPCHVGNIMNEYFGLSTSSYHAKNKMLRSRGEAEGITHANPIECKSVHRTFCSNKTYGSPLLEPNI